MRSETAVMNMGGSHLAALIQWPTVDAEGASPGEVEAAAVGGHSKVLQLGRVPAPVLGSHCSQPSSQTLSTFDRLSSFVLHTAIALYY